MHPPGVMRPPPGYRQQPPPSSRQLLGNFYDDEDTSPERGQGRRLMAGDGRSMTLITPDTFTVLPPLTPPPEPVIRPPAPVAKPSQKAPSRTQASSRPFSTNSPPYRRGRKASFVILTAQDPRLPGSASSSRNVSPERPSFGPGVAPNQTQRKPSRIPRSQPVSREPSPTRRRSLGNLQRRGSLSPIKHTAASLKRLQVARSRPSSPKAQHRQPPARRPSKRFVPNNQPDSPSKIPVAKEVNNNNNKQQQPKKTSITETRKQSDTRHHSQSSTGAKTQSHSATEAKKDTKSVAETKSQSNSTTEPKKQPQVKKTSLNGTNRQSTVFRKNSNLHPVAGKPPLPPGAGRGRAGAKNSTSTKSGTGVGRGRKESDTRVLINPTMASAPASTDTPATNSRPSGDQTTTTTSTTATTSGLAPSAGASIVSITTHPALELAGEPAVTAAAQPASQEPAPGPATASGGKSDNDHKSSNTGSSKDDKPSEEKGAAAAAAAAASAKSATTKSATAKATSTKSSAASKKTEPEAAAGTGVDGAAGGEEAVVTEAVGASLESVRTTTSETTIRAASSPRPKKKTSETEATSEAVIQGEPDLETLSANVKQAALPEPNTGGSTSTHSPPEPVKQKGGILARLCVRDAAGMKECCRRCCCCCCRKGSNAAAAAGDRRKSNATTTTSKKQSRSSSTAVEPDTRPKLDPSLMEHGSLIRSAIPVLPIPLAWICLIFNILVPGFGTVSSGLFCLCFGKPRMSPRDDPQGRISTFILNIFVSALQLFTVVFCFVGWGWSIWWGIIMVKISRKYRKLKRAEAASQRVENQLATPATVQQNHDPERGLP